MTYTVVPEDILLRSDGKPFRCHCGANVFRPVRDYERPNEKIYQCNGCREWYTESDKKKEEKKMPEDAIHLGDGVYARYISNSESIMAQIKLYTLEGDVIYLNDDNLPALLDYIKKLTGEE